MSGVLAAQARPRILEAERSGRVLADKIGLGTRELTLADASAQSGLALRDAERGLQWALKEFRGHLKVTDKGELIFSFPTGFRRPWVVRETLGAWARRMGRAVVAGLKVAVKVWILAAVVLYAVGFAAIALALTFAALSQDRDSRDHRHSSRGFGLGDFLMWRLLSDLMFDAMYGASHVRGGRRVLPRRAGRPGPKVRLYERLFQFIFGPETPPQDPLVEEQRLLAMVRARHGRVGVADVMAITGLDNDGAERRITRLLVDYEGEIQISEEGGVYYVFSSVMRSVAAVPVAASASWERPVTVPALTGDNSAEANLAVFGVNFFNLAMGFYGVTHAWTVENIVTLVTRPGMPLMDGSTPVLLGWVPLTFSAALFAIPGLRWLWRRRQVNAAQLANGRRGLLRVITADPQRWHLPQTLAQAWQQAAGLPPSSERQLTDELLRLGGDLKEDDQGVLHWRFPDLAREGRALVEARNTAPDEERQAGSVVFDSAN